MRDAGAAWALAVVVALGPAASPALAAKEVALAAPWSGGEAGFPGEPAIEAAILAMVNEERAKVGAAPVVRDPRLEFAARQHSWDMNTFGYFGHVSPSKDVAEPQQRAWMTGYYAPAGENCVKAWHRGSAEATARMMMDSWMGSPRHRANMLRADAKDVGIGVHDKDGVLMATQLFGNGEVFRVHSFTAEDQGATLKLRVRLEQNPGTAFRSIKVVKDGNGDAPYVRLAADGPTTVTCTVTKEGATGLAFHAIEKAVVGKVRGEGRIEVVTFWTVDLEDGEPVLKIPYMPQ